MSDNKSPSLDPLHADSPAQHRQRIGRRRFLTLSAQALSTLAAGSLLPQALAATAPDNSTTTLAATVGSANARVLSQICERILPTTDTPGAIAAGVPEFFADVLNNVYLDSDTTRFITRLNAFSAVTEAEHGAAFDELESAAQDARLQAMTADPGSEEAAFFDELRLLTVRGYYTSELGATSEHALSNHMAPWNGDIAYADVGRMWTG